MPMSEHDKGKSEVLGASATGGTGNTESAGAVQAAAAEPSGTVKSFEVVRGGTSGDMLTEKYKAPALKVGLLATGYFEFWRWYPDLRSQIEGDMQQVASRLGRKHPLVFTGFADTLDLADAAGRRFREERVDLIVIVQGTWTPDYFIHRALAHVPSDTPILIFATWVRDRLDWKTGYKEAIRNWGPMGLVQLTGGFHKMHRWPNYEVVVGLLDDEKAYEAIDRFIQVRTTIRNMRHWTIGVVGHVFRGMYDFNYDKTSVQGMLGPEIVDIHIDHLLDILSEISDSDPRVVALQKKVRKNYKVSRLDDSDLMRASRVAVAMLDLVERYRLDGLALLGQHFIEKHAKSTVHLGISEILLSDRALAVTEGDVLGLVISMVLKDFTGHTPFFGEWAEADIDRNALMFDGHGFLDPREAHPQQPVEVGPPAEEWGFEGNGFGFQANYRPGPVTLAHIIQDPDGWRMLLMGGEVLDLPPLPMDECTLVVRIKAPVMDFWRSLLKAGFPHHAMIVPSDCQEQMECFAQQLGIKVHHF